MDKERESNRREKRKRNKPRIKQQKPGATPLQRRVDFALTVQQPLSTSLLDLGDLPFHTMEEVEENEDPWLFVESAWSIKQQTVRASTPSLVPPFELETEEYLEGQTD